MRVIIRENRVFVFKVIVIFIFSYILISAFNFDSNLNEQNTISVNAEGEVRAVPNIANISFTISKTAKTTKEAGEEVKKIQDKVMSSLRENNIEDKDIKTSDLSFYPKYEYRKDLICNGYECPHSNVIVGYTYSLNLNVKIREIDNTPKVIEDLSKLEINNLSGPNFSIEDEEELKKEARKIAIKKAKKEARELARDLGVRMHKIVSFTESSDYYPMPYRAKMSMEVQAIDLDRPIELPKGENVIKSNITIVYSIR